MSQTKKELSLFFGLTFLVTWGIASLFVFAPGVIVPWHGPMNDRSAAFYLAVYAPSVVAIVLTCWLGGRQGLKQLLAGLSLRAHPLWWAAVFLGYPSLFLMWNVIDAAFLPGGATAPSWEAFFLTYPAALLLAWPPRLVFDPGPVGEEFGWRGFALPRLLNLMPALHASLLLGFIWGLWHFPAYVLGDDLGRSMWDFPWFVLAEMSISILFTWVYLRTRGNFLLAGILAHLVINTCASAGLYPSMQIVALVTSVAALALILITGRGLGGCPQDWSPQATSLTNAGEKHTNLRQSSVNRGSGL